MQNLSINLNGYVIKNDAVLDPVIMTEPPEEAIDHLDYTFEDMHTYSHLNYLSYKASAGFVYTFTNGMRWNLEGSYYGIDDRTGYIYGDESGTLLIIRSGIQIDFK